MYPQTPWSLVIVTVGEKAPTKNPVLLAPFLQLYPVTGLPVILWYFLNILLLQAEGLEENSSVKFLGLPYSSLDEQTLFSIISKLKDNLETLNISKGDVSGKKMFFSFRKLGALDLSECQSLTNAGLFKILKSHSKCWICRRQTFLEKAFLWNYLAWKFWICNCVKDWPAKDWPTS